MNRRSIRAYLDKPIEQEKLDALCQAGIYAPSSGSRQGVVIVVCTNADINERLGKINKGFFTGHMSTDSRFISKEQPSIADDSSVKSAFYGAPVVMTLFAPKGWLYAEMDCAVTAENIMLMAESLGLGSCFVARSAETFETDYGQSLAKQWGVPENYGAVVHITLGYSQKKALQAKGRKEGRVIQVS